MKSCFIHEQYYHFIEPWTNGATQLYDSLGKHLITLFFNGTEDPYLGPADLFHLTARFCCLKISLNINES